MNYRISRTLKNPEEYAKKFPKSDNQKKRTAVYILSVCALNLIITIGIFVALIVVFCIMIPYELNFNIRVGDRYDFTSLESYLNVLFSNETDVIDLHTFSGSINCPWMEINDEFDFFMKNMSKVMVCAPGQLTSIYEEFEEKTTEGMKSNITINYEIKFNNSITLLYRFRHSSPSVTAYVEAQRNLIDFEEDDWFEAGDVLGSLYVIDQDYDYVSFKLVVDNVGKCPERYFSANGIQRMNELILYINPTFNVCYD